MDRGCQIDLSDTSSRSRVTREPFGGDMGNGKG